MNRARLKGLVSTILIVAFLLSAVTGIVMLLIKDGMVLGLPRAYWKWAHHAGGLTMIAAMALHLPLNWKQYRAEIRRPEQTEADREQRHEAQ